MVLRSGWALALSLVAASCFILAALRSGAIGGGATTLYGEVARPMGSLQLEPEHWASEDSAEHAFNLELWRTEVLKAKVAQADLRKKLFAASSVPEVEGQDDNWRRRAVAPPQQLALPVQALPVQPARGGDAQLVAEAAEIKGLRKDLLGVASQTANALSHLTRTVNAMNRHERSAARRAPAQSLAHAPAEVHTMGREEAVRRQREERDAQRVQEVARRGRDAGRGEKEAAKRVRVSMLRAKMAKMLGSLTQAVTLAEQDKQVRRVVRACRRGVVRGCRRGGVRVRGGHAMPHLSACARLSLRSRSIV